MEKASRTGSISWRAASSSGVGSPASLPGGAGASSGTASGGAGSSSSRAWSTGSGGTADSGPGSGPAGATSCSIGRTSVGVGVSPARAEMSETPIVSAPTRTIGKNLGDVVWIFMAHLMREVVGGNVHSRAPGHRAACAASGDLGAREPTLRIAAILLHLGWPSKRAGIGGYSIQVR